MISRELVLSVMKEYGKTEAQKLQKRAESMTGTELYDENGFIPSFQAACAKMNMLQRPVGFVCRSPKGRVVKLIQPYDSTIYTQDPEALSAHYRFVWSKNPKHALPFASISTSPFDKDECTVGRDGVTYASEINTNTWDPVDNPQFWRVVEE